MPQVFDLKLFLPPGSLFTLLKDIDGREMRVRFSVQMNPGRRNPETMSSSPLKVIYYESPHKLYVGNLSRAVKPEDLWNHFRRIGTVVSVRILHDHKEGNNRIYAFLSFLSKFERDAAMTLNGTVNSASITSPILFLVVQLFVCYLLWFFLQELGGRTIVVREGVERTRLTEFQV